MNTAALRLTMIIALIGLSWGLSAQQPQQPRQYYHNVGDTIYDSNAIYFWQWHPTRWIDSSRHNDIAANLIFCEWYDDILSYCYTDHPINIIGIAGACTIHRIDHLAPPDTIMPRREFLRIYDACPDSFPLKKEVEWHHVPPDRYLSLKSQKGTGQCCEDNIIGRDVVPIYEFYFDDKPVTVTDSFYVGGTMYSSGDLTDPENPSRYIINDHYTAYYALVGFSDKNSFCPQCPRPHLLQKYRSRYHQTFGQWIWKDSERFLLIFPIIEIDTTYNPQPQDTFVCPTASGLQVASQSDQTTWLMWNSSSEHQSWQISYGEAGTAPGEGTTDSVSGPPIFSIVGLDSCRSYVAYVRAVCEHGDSTYFSDWSDPLDIYHCDHPVSIESSSPLDQFTQIIPSPASGTAQVVSSFQLQRIEVFNTAGTSVYDSSADGISHSIDVSGWESGFYFAVIHSAGGIVTKKLVVK